ncbi:MAG: EamA family transporter [Bacteroidota bacterium]
MIYLILTIFFSVGIVIIFKLFTGFNINNNLAITVNYVIAAFAGFIAYDSEITMGGIVYSNWFYWAVAVGIAFIATFYIFAISAQKAGVAISAVAGRMSVLIPVIIGIAFYGDNINIIIFSGIILSLIAFYLIFQKNSKIKLNKKYVIFPFFLFLGFGFNDSVLKHAEKFHINDDYYLFLAVVFSVSLIIGIVVFIIQYIKNRQRIRYKDIIAGAFLGVFNFLSTYYFLKGMAHFDSSVYFPVVNTGIVSFGALSGFFFFKEDVSLKNWIGIVLAIAAILLLTLG